MTTAQLPAVQDDRIVGHWKAGKDLIIIQRSGNEYLYGEPDDYAKGGDAIVHMTLAAVGRRTIVEAKTAARDCARFGGEPANCYLLLGVVEIGQDEMTFRRTDSARLVEYSVAGRLQAPHKIHRSVNSQKKAENEVLFDVSPGELATAVASEAFGVVAETMRFVRVR
jgi:hypothetical protein